jgi:predicted nucleotidyltransferase
MPTLNGYPISESELAFLRELSLRGARFMVVGMVSAIMQGADTGTRDIDLWFATTSDVRLSEAALSVGGLFIWRANPPCLGGKELDRFDLVNQMNGLDDFESEYQQAIDCQIDDFQVKLLPLRRIIVSKQAAGRSKDLAALPALRAALESSKYFSS